jgi:hypothetical protein
MKNSRSGKGMLSSQEIRKATIPFFENIMERKFSDAIKSLEKIRGKNFNSEEFKEGYIHALEGVLLSSRSGDERDFYNKPVLELKEINRYKKSFRDLILEGQHTVFDEGYFSAWSDLMHYRFVKEKKAIK